MAIRDIVPIAVSLLVLRQDGKILAISRKDNENDFGLPGGKVDRGETAEAAIIREAREETGLLIYMVTPVFTRICRGEVDYLNITFASTEYINAPKQQKGEGRLAWIPFRLLYFGSFGPYNAHMMRSLMIEKETAVAKFAFDFFKNDVPSNWSTTLPLVNLFQGLLEQVEDIP